MKRRRKNTHYTPWKMVLAIIFLSGLFALSVQWVWDMSSKKERADVGFQEVLKRHNYLEQRSRVLKERNNFLHTATGQQDYLVNRHAMVHKGERVLILVEGAVSRPSQALEQEKTPWWKFW